MGPRCCPTTEDGIPEEKQSRNHQWTHQSGMHVRNGSKREHSTQEWCSRYFNFIEATVLQKTQSSSTL